MSNKTKIYITDDSFEIDNFKSMDCVCNGNVLVFHNDKNQLVFSCHTDEYLFMTIEYLDEK